ncbi:C2H2 zinc finger protein [Paecilomyces variotii No. 5]|uniref:Protein SIP5 n=1 Tax=Byssochlamys spectabilis (strain No. 5 / NBRC 109023) TaxID=1356009 RepID=V5FEU6_BYSSN|nr:C2H2 zinc finger protein [Paecilomyces variotii No. 5]
MGNAQTKEARPPHAPNYRRTRHHSHDSGSGHGRSPYHGDGSRAARTSRPDLSFLGIGGSSDRDVAMLEHRRETKQEREARRLERERVARLKERERSMREEHVDGGYLVTQGVYVGTEDFNKAVVRQLMIERRLAPFWRGLNDFSDSWTEHQLMAAARGMPIPPPDEIPQELQYKLPQKVPDGADSSDRNINSLTVPITSRTPSYNSDASQGGIPAQSLPSPTSPIASATGSATSPLFRGRAKTLAALTKNNAQNDMTPREITLPQDPFVNGQPIEAYLYKDATECPICFLYYPPYLNTTRCCHQPICSECFVQIKRPDPHPPEHGEPDPNAPPSADDSPADIQLVSEPSACPFCVQPEFGVTYTPPPFRRGLVYAANPNARQSAYPVSPVSSSSSLTPDSANQQTGRRRATSLSASDPAVVTTDKIRPDWAQKLANARAHAARRSAAATALHTAAYLMHPPSNGGESRNLLGRRGLRRTDDGTTSTRTGSPALNALAFLTERQRSTRQDSDSAEEAPSMLAPPRESSRRTRIDDLEEMMMMEAIRMSLASEEERRKKAEKEAKKEAKRREKEAKKAEKSLRKNGGDSNSGSSLALNVRPGSSAGRVDSSSSSIITGDEALSAGKGKGVDRVSPAVAETASPDSEPSQSNSATAGPQLSIFKPDPDLSSSSAAQPSPTEPAKRSHLRHVSSASSSSSSLVESTSGEHIGSAGPGGSNTSLEPMFNFRSLAAVIGDEDKHDASAQHVENTVSEQQAESSGSHVPGESGSLEKTAPEFDKVQSIPNGIRPAPNLAHENGDNLASKELEANSVEIMGANGNTETAS